MASTVRLSVWLAGHFVRFGVATYLPTYLPLYVYDSMLLAVFDLFREVDRVRQKTGYYYLDKTIPTKVQVQFVRNKTLFSYPVLRRDNI